MEEFDFTEEEIKDQLKQLGYYNVSMHQLEEFKKDLQNLVRHERSKNSSWATVSESAQSRVESDDNIHIYRPQTVPAESTFKPFSQYQTQSRPVLTHNVERPVQQPKQAFSGPETSYGVPAFRGEHLLDEDTEEADTTLNTTGSTERRIMKRKVLRKIDGQSKVFDESSVTESDFTDDVSEVEERLRDLPLNDRPKTAPSGERRRIYGLNAVPERPQTARSSSSKTPTYGVPEEYDGPKALIKPMASHPHTRNIQKHDVVSRGQLYRQSWNCQRAPGEKNHKNLRWNVRGQMLYHDKVVDKKQQRVFIPNKFKIPSDKKRKNLRWQVRQDLAQGVVPPSIYE